jgi:hypothetical protein
MTILCGGLASQGICPIESAHFGSGEIKMSKTITESLIVEQALSHTRRMTP